MSSPYAFIVSGVAFAKKGDAQPFRIGFTPEVPFPCLADNTTSRWSGLGTLEPSTYRNAEGVRLPTGVHICFLRTDTEEWKGNRTDHAGYLLRTEPDPARPATHVLQYHAPGSLVFRGETVGEVTGYVSHRYGSPVVDYKNGNYNTITGGLDKWFQEFATPLILAAIKENADTIRKWQIDSIRARFADRLEEGRKRLEESRLAAENILKELEG